MPTWISESQFRADLKAALATITEPISAVTGPGRSGAITAAYASHMLSRPFLPQGQHVNGTTLVIDTVSQTGKTMRKAMLKLITKGVRVVPVTVYKQQERLKFWYEEGSPFNTTAYDKDNGQHHAAHAHAGNV